MTGIDLVSGATIASAVFLVSLMRMLDPIVLAFLVYLLAVLVIGVWSWRQTRDRADYFLGGRRLGSLTTALSAGASDMSGWLLLGLPGLAFSAGSAALWLAGGLLLGSYLNWLLLARRLRCYSAAAGNALTIPELLANRFGDPGHVLRTVAALFILLFFAFYVSAGLVAGGKLFATLFGLDSTSALLLTALFIVSYTLFGGYLAVCWTDVLQALLMAAALVVVPLVALHAAGGLGAFAAVWPTSMAEWFVPASEGHEHPLNAVAIMSLAAWGLGYFGQPHILARFAGIRDPAAVPSARRIALGWTAVTLSGALAVGFIGRVYAEAHWGGTLADPETIFMALVNALFPPWLAGVLLAAILAAIMSTADSQLLVCAAALTEDLYRPWSKRPLGADAALRLARAGMAWLALIALGLALFSAESVLNLVGYAWAGLGAAFGPTLVLSLYWPRMTRAGALAGIIVGGCVAIMWKYTAIWREIYEIVPAVIAATVAIVAVSLRGGPPAVHSDGRQC